MKKTYDVYMSYTGERTTVDGRTLSRMKVMMSDLLSQGFDPEELFIEMSSSDDGEIRHRIVTDITTAV